MSDAVWDWAERLSESQARRRRVEELRKELARDECGSCTRWMTRGCPREEKGIMVACHDYVCAQFNRKPWDTERLEKLKAELHSLTSKETP